MGVVSGGSSGGALSGVTVSGTAAAGQVPVASSSAAGAWAYPPGFELAYVEITASVNIVGTSEATATTIVSAGAVTFDGTPVVLEFFSPEVRGDTAAAADVIQFFIFDSATSQGMLGQWRVGQVTANAETWVYLRRKFTPSAAAHTFSVTAATSATTGTPLVLAGSGGVGNPLPSYVRITKA